MPGDPLRQLPAWLRKLRKAWLETPQDKDFVDTAGELLRQRNNWRNTSSQLLS
jgi:hypothetical protein